jgi:CheY-like chemotaxis protein
MSIAIIAAGRFEPFAADLAAAARAADGEVTTVATVGDLLEAAQRLRPEVVLLDLETLRRDELIDAIASPGLASAAVLAVLSEVTLDTALRAAGVGAHDFLVAAELASQGSAYLTAASVPPTGGAPTQQRRVMLADATDGRAHWLSFLLLRAGFEVVRVSDREEGLRILEESQGDAAIDLVVIDFGLQRCDPASFLALAAERMAVPPPPGIAMLEPDTPPETAAAALASGYRHLYHTRRPPDELVFLANESTMLDHGRLRAAARFPCAALVRFREAGGPWRHGLSYNVSVSGLYVRTILPPPGDTVVDVEIAPTSGGVIAARARVAWQRPFALRANRSVPTGMGLKLCEPDLEVQRAMAVFVLQLADTVD